MSPKPVENISLMERTDWRKFEDDADMDPGERELVWGPSSELSELSP